MSQEYTSNRRARRAGRSSRNKPVLVTPSGDEVVEEQNEQMAQEITAPVVPVAESTPLLVPTPAPTQPRRLPRFFSNVKKSEQDTAVKETRANEVVQARLARATRGKTTTEVPAAVPALKDDKATPEKENKTTSTPSAARPVPNRANTAQTGIFKTRYIIGMGLYLLCANFIGIYETQFLRSIGQDKPLGPVLFGAFQPRTSSILFLATLVIILVLLARFDLIPRSFSAAANRTAQRSGQKQPQNSTTQSEKVMPPTVRQGVKGADDKLYQEYRASQRREKKR